MLAALLTGLWVAGGSPQEVPDPRLVAFVEQHCAACHENPEADAELDLVALAGQPLADNAEPWSWVARQLEAGTMPPAKRPRPAPDELEALLGLLAGLVPDEPEAPPAAGMRRLNRRELRNAVRDLLGVELPHDALPVETKLHDFDVVASSATLDDAWMNRWLDLALEAADRAVALPVPEPVLLRFGAADFDIHPGGRLTTNGYTGVDHLFTAPGTYRLAGRAWAQQAGPDLARVALVFDEDALDPLELEGEGPEAAAWIEAELQVARGRWSVGVAFQNDYFEPGAEDPDDRDRNVIVEELSIEGPLEARGPGDFQRELFARYGPALGERRLEAMLRHLARLAWRREPAEEALRDLVALTRDEPGLEARLRLGIAALLGSPRFLFVPEVGPTLDDHALATRLALGLWGSLPDEALLAAADRGELSGEDGLLAQFERMLASERSLGLVRGFVPQWLQLERLAGHRPDPERFPDYRSALTGSMLEEPVALFAAILREDRPATELLTADWTVLDARLAAHYGLELPAERPGEGGARVSLARTGRRGLLGPGAVLTATSDPGRTSPVLRGKWVLEALLGDPPPPPPPGVLTLDETAPPDPSHSIRARLEQHRSNPGCAACHASLDPLGFALEGFDAIGRERPGEVDELGELPDGTRIEGARALAELLEDDPRFLRQLTESLAVWMTARTLEPGDRAELEQLVRSLEAGSPTLRELLRAIVASDLFRAPATGRQP